jgi:hypothetical protein
MPIAELTTLGKFEPKLSQSAGRLAAFEEN